MGPCCPGGKTRIPFGRTQWGLGKSFQCGQCNQALVVPKSLSSIGIGLFVAYWSLRDRAEGGAQTFMLIAGLMMVGLVSSWLFGKPQRAS